MEIEDIYKLYCNNFLVDTDTRSIRKGTIFFALKGSNFDGNKFVKEALNKGASYCVIDDKDFFIEGKTILVTNVLEILQKLANFHRKKLNLPIISLTGSNGKTTTKELINEVLKTQYETVATKGNLNNHIGVPLTLLSFTNETELGIVEMGANHQKEIEFLCQIAEPDYGYITNFGKAHLEGFGGVEGVIKGKSELYKHLSTHNKVAFVNADDSKQMEITTGSERVLVGPLSEFVEADPFVKIKFNNDLIQTNLIGDYNYKNIRAAIEIGKFFGIENQNIKKGIENYTPKNNRSEIIKTSSNKILLDAYNANPSSMELALLNFSKIKHDHKIVILGDMFELGDVAALEHQKMADLASNLGFSKVLLVGENFYKAKAENKFIRFEDLTTFLKENPIENSYLLVKGSRGMALERVVEIID